MNMKTFTIIAVFMWLWSANFGSCTNGGNPLYLTPLIESGNLENARQMSRVKSRHFGCNTDSYSGFLTVDKNYHSNLFFWFFKSKNTKAPLLLWLQGGPGMTSMIGLFDEIGPFEIQNDINLRCRKHSWTNAFSVVFIDSPVGTGFSFTRNSDGYATTLQNVTDNLYNALKQFFTLFSDQKSNDFYLTGESYAGKYIPSLAYKIHTSNESVINLKGIAIGSGLIDPISSLSYGPLLYQFGLIDDNQLKLFNSKENEIQSLILNKQFATAFNKLDILVTKLIYQKKTLYENTIGYDSYFFDVRDSKAPLNFTLIELFLNKTEIRQALHVASLPYVFGADNNDPVVKPMASDIPRSVKSMMPVLMENYKVLLYNGNLDIIVPGVIGNQFLKTLEWKYRGEYLQANRTIWKVHSNDTEVAGYIKRVRNFSEVIVRNAGHMVPISQPRVVLNMIVKFVNGNL